MVNTADMYTINAYGKVTSGVMTLVMFRISTGEVFNEFDDGGGLKRKYKVFEISSGISLPTAFWDSKQKLCTGKYTTLNKEIDELKQQVIRFVEVTYNKVTLTELKERLKLHVIHDPLTKYEAKAKAAIPTELVDYINYKIIEWSSGANTKKKNTIKNYRKFNNWLMRYPVKLDLLTLNDVQVKRFIEWMANQTKEDGSKYKVNYLNFFRKTIKVLVNEAINEDDLDVKVNLKKKAFKKISEQPDDVYLSLNQIEKLKKVKYQAHDETILKIGTSKSLFDKVKDLAIISASCGYRWSDLHTINSETFIEDKKTGMWYFTLSKTKKTGARVVIPCFDLDVVQILKKYKFELPLMAEQTFNETVKIICRLAGMVEEKTQYNKDPLTLEQIPSKKKFYQIVSHRTFRKTFASNLIREYNVPLVIAMSYTGHTTESSFRHYIRLTPEEYYQIGVRAMNAQKSFLRIA